MKLYTSNLILALIRFASVVSIICIPLFLLPCHLSAKGVDENALQHTETLIKRNPDAAFIRIKSLLHQAKQNNDRYTIAACYEQIGELFYYQSAYTQALDNYYKADNIFRAMGHTRELARNLNRIGETYYYNRQYDRALKTFQEALSIYKKINSPEGMANSYGFIGQTYEKHNDHRQALAYQHKALEELNRAENKTGVAKIYENIGSVYEDRLQLDSALHFFNAALQLNIISQDNMAQMEVLNNIGDVYRKNGHYHTALTFTHQAEALARQMNDPYQLSSAYRDLSKTFDLLKQYDSAYYYSEVGREIFLDIFSKDNKKQMLLLQTLFEIEQKDNAILKLESERKTNQQLSIASTLIVLLLVCLAISVISRQRLKLKNQRDLAEQNKNLFDAERRAMETDLYNKQLQQGKLNGELELKNKELTSHTLHLIQKNQLLDELKDKLADMVKDDKRDQRREMKQLLNLISQSANQDKNWDDFRIVFERVHENFFERLKKYSLTSADYRLVALLKMNLNSADIATMLGISQDSLRTARYRLRKKLNLEEGENLITFIQSL